MQKQVEVPADISSPFDDHGERLALSIAAAKAEAESVAPTPIPSRHGAAAPPSTLAPTPAAIPSRSSISTVSSPVPAELNAAPDSCTSAQVQYAKGCSRTHTEAFGSKCLGCAACASRNSARQTDASPGQSNGSL